MDCVKCNESFDVAHDDNYSSDGSEFSCPNCGCRYNAMTCEVIEAEVVDY